MSSRLSLVSAAALSALFSAGLAPALFAQDGDAAGEGDVTDVEPAGKMVWTLGDQPMNYITTASVMDTVRIGSVAVYPIEIDGGPAKLGLEIGGFESISGGGSLFIYAEFDKDPAKDAVITLAQYQPDTANPPIWTNDGTQKEPVTVRFDTWEFDGKTGKVAGTFAGDLCKASDWEAQPDPNDCVRIEGSFESEVFSGL